MDKKFVKLGDKFYHISMKAPSADGRDEGGMELVPATPDQVINEQLEQIVLVDDGEDPGKNFIQDIVDRTKQEMEKHLRAGIQKTVLRSLGFEMDRDGFRVDHCNSRMSEVGNYIKISLQQILGDIKVEDLVITKKQREAVIEGYRKDMLGSYKDQIRRHMWSEVEHMVRNDAKLVAESLMKDRTEEVGKMILDKLLK